MLDVEHADRRTPLTEEPRARRFAVAWRHPSSGRTSPIGLLTYAQAQYTFVYLASARDVADFRPLLGFPDVAKEYRAPRLFTFFAQRVMDPRRPDYERYLNALDLPLSASRLDVLGRSGGRRKADKVQVTEEPQVTSGGETRHVFLVPGVRYGSDPGAVAALADVEPGSALSLVPEPDNPVNPRALLVATPSGAVGWVPDLLLDYVHAVVRTGGEELTVRRVNDASMPAHLRLVAQISGRAPRNYEAFSGPDWRPALLAATDP